MFSLQYQQNEDYLIQRRLLILMTILEVSLALAAVTFLYFRFEAIVEARIYRFHNSSISVLQEYWLTIAIILGVIVVCNLIAIVVAHFVWVKYVNTVIARLGHDLERIARLDFSKDESRSKAIHPVLQDLDSWIEAERNLNTEIHRSLAEVRAESDPARMLAWARRMAARLPKADSQQVASSSHDSTL
jgi:hypothetical protein